MPDRGNRPRKPAAKVVSLKGSHQPDVITQVQLADMETAQLVEWEAAKRAHALSATLRSRLEHGASIETGRLYYDDASGLVRSRKAGGE